MYEKKVLAIIAASLTKMPLTRTYFSNGDHFPIARYCNLVRQYDHHYAHAYNRIIRAMIAMASCLNRVRPHRQGTTSDSMRGQSPGQTA